MAPFDVLNLMMDLCRNELRATGLDPDTASTEQMEAAMAKVRPQLMETMQNLIANGEVDRADVDALNAPPEQLPRDVLAFLVERGQIVPDGQGEYRAADPDEDVDRLVATEMMRRLRGEG